MAYALPGSLATRLTVAAMLMVFCALNIHQSYGMIELHFGIFVCLAFLLCYRDWRPIAFGAVVTAIHHLSFNYFQELGYGVMCFTQTGSASSSPTPPTSWSKRRCFRISRSCCGPRASRPRSCKAW